jgi:hypothetical protein
MRVRGAAIFLGLALSAAGCGQEFKLPPIPPPETTPDAGRYHFEMKWNFTPPPGDIAVRGAYVYVITQRADTVKAQVKVFLANKPDPIAPTSGGFRPFTGLEDPTRICVVQGDSTFVLVADRHEVMRTDTTSVVIDSAGVGGPYDTTFVTQEVVRSRSWSVKRFHFTGGAPLASFGLPGPFLPDGPVDLNRWVEVNGLAADENLNIYVSDAIRDVVDQYDRKGRLLKHLSTRGTGDGYINQACGVNWNGVELIVADTGQDRVAFLDRNAVETATRRPVGTTTGPFSPRRPEDVASDRAQTFVYVADTGRDRILKYRLTGEFVDSVYSAQVSFPSGAELARPIRAPRFVAVEEPLVFVSDPENNRLVVFALAKSF